MSMKQMNRGRRAFVAVLLAATVAAPVALASSPASAASFVNGPRHIQCGVATVSLGFPAVIGTPGYPESVVWMNEVQRWNGRSWVVERVYYHWARYNSYGFNVSGWSAVPNQLRGAYQANNLLNLPVGYHGAFYRVRSAVLAANGGYWEGYAEAGRYCQTL